jgi:hypothetical protein
MWGSKPLPYLVIALLLAACAPQAAPIILPTATPTFRSPTATVPSATVTASDIELPITPSLGTHTWKPKDILVSVGFTCGVCGPNAILPELVVYSDGHVIAKGEFDTTTYHLREGWLSSSEVCKVLNTIQQTGFFEYDESVYGLEGDAWDYVEVNAWLENSATHVGLFTFIIDDGLQARRECENCAQPTLMPAIVDTYRFLYQFAPELTPLEKPEAILFVSEIENPDSLDLDSIPEWPNELPSLLDAVDAASCNQDEFVTIVIDQQVSDTIPYTDREFLEYVEDGRLFYLIERSSFPNEIIPACGQYTTLNNPNIPVASPESLTCSPEDGFYQIESFSP